MIALKSLRLNIHICQFPSTVASVTVFILAWNKQTSSKFEASGESFFKGIFPTSSQPMGKYILCDGVCAVHNLRECSLSLSQQYPLSSALLGRKKAGKWSYATIGACTCGLPSSLAIVDSFLAVLFHQPRTAPTPLGAGSGKKTKQAYLGGRIVSGVRLF